MRPYAVTPREESPRETTLRALVLGTLLSVVMLAANMYLGLRVGMTVSASIPAAVISMAILRGMLRTGTILENNIVQTMASTGESLAAGVIFTIPALLFVNVWSTFAFWPTMLIACLGGLLGVLLMIPMRRALIVNRPDLAYPEGVACAEVLKAGEAGGSGVRLIGAGLLLGALVKFLDGGIHLLRHTVEGAMVKGKTLLYFGADLSPALLAVGYIVDLHIASLVFLGGAFSWLMAIPLAGGGDAAGAPLDAVWAIWKSDIRYLGVGAMLVGGLHAVWSVRHGLAAGLRAVSGLGRNTGPESGRTDRDLPASALAALLLAVMAGTFGLYIHLVGGVLVAGLATVAMLAGAFLFVAVATYIVGLVGSSNSPVSGMTICALLLAALVLLGCGVSGATATLAVLGVAGVVCCAVCTAGDIAQDLKTGSLVGATPARQQWCQILSVVIPAFFVAPVLTLLHRAYTIGSEQLLAPQAALFAGLAQGFFGDGGLPWGMVGAGAGIGVALLAVNWLLRRFGWRYQAHLMPVAVGMYLPLALAVPMLAGGILRYAASRNSAESGSGRDTGPGVLFGSGLIAGEAIMGILLAVPIVLGISLGDAGSPLSASLIAFAVLILLYIMVIMRRSHRA